MTCREAQAFITPFINNKLNLKELEEFLSHINSCKECREELEVYYALITAMKQLDEDKEFSDDFSLELTTKLENAKEKIIHHKLSYYRKKAALILLVIFLSIVASIQHLFFNEKINPVTKSDFILRVQYNQERFDKYNDELSKQSIDKD